MFTNARNSIPRPASRLSAKSKRLSPPRRRALAEPLESRLLLAGDFAYAFPIGGPALDNPATDQSNSTAIDRFGNLYVVGSFWGTADFNPSPRRVYNLTAHPGNRDAFVAKYAPNGQLLWAVSAGGVGDDEAASVVVDRSGNAYIGGYFTGTADFKPGRRISNLIASGGDLDADAYVWKIDPNGALLAARSAGGASFDAIDTLAIDANGNVSISGFFNANAGQTGSANFGALAINTHGYQDAFIAQLSPRFRWNFAIPIGSDSFDTGRGISTDAAGNLYATGAIGGVTDFDPGPGVTNLTPTGSTDGFLLKLTPTGNFAYARRFAATSSFNGSDAYSVAVDRFGNANVTGAFSGTVDFNPGAGIANRTTNSNSDAFVVKLDSAGNYLWNTTTSTTLSGSGTGKTIVVDRIGNAYVVGDFTQGDFNPNGATTNYGLSDRRNGFVWKIKPNGVNDYIKDLIPSLAPVLGTSPSGQASGQGIALSAIGDIFVTGVFYDKVDFRSGAGDFILDTGGYGTSDAFVLKLLA